MFNLSLMLMQDGIPYQAFISINSGNKEELSSVSSSCDVPGVVNVVPSSRPNTPAVGNLMCTSPKVAGVSFTGMPLKALLRLVPLVCRPTHILVSCLVLDT